MNKKFITAALALVVAMGVSAQEKVYLIKGNEVVAKYNVSDVDYVSFHLPEGVKDNTGGGEVLKQTYISALGTYFGTKDEVADYQVQLSTRAVSDEAVPVEFLYLQFMGPAADYKNLALPEGTFTMRQGDERAALKFYEGVSEQTPEGEGVGGSMLLTRPSREEDIVALVNGGTFTISKVENGYTISGKLTLNNGNELEFSYTGACVIDNQSDEKDPAEILPLPESKLTEDIAFAAKDAYYGTYGELFSDKPGCVYNYVYLYDASQTEIIEMGFLINSSKAGGKFLPKGKYPVAMLGTSEYNSGNDVAIGPFQIKGETTIGTYGCWITHDFQQSPLVSGEIEVLDDFDGKGKLNIKLTLKDNAATPHTVTASFNGNAEKL